MSGRKSIATALAACCLWLASAPALAATCTVANVTIAFGNYNPISASPTSANTSVTVSCSALLGSGGSSTVSYSILLSGGNSGNTASRAMSLTSKSLPYNLYTTSGYATVWDNTTGVSGSILLQGPLGLPVLVSGSDSKTVYGRILAQQPATSGGYTDSLVLTVNY